MPQHLPDDAPERTLILVKPDGVARGLTGEILRRIEAKGYVLKGLRLEVAPRETLEQHYAEHRGRPFYEGLVSFMGSGPLVAALVEGERVVEGMRVLMGSTDPTLAPAGTIRGDLGRAWDTPHMENLIHGSDSVESARREIALWFPEAD
ncbi:nucleoside-diphosphate kinase [Actinomyces sp. B33]|uniref:nucleoside-diphosphate kinase n=1 Tax=Actinomyces sp. B33 TaxID=2942131 RepID=UPI002342190F|nr:nucleoside-diphosphate kinase [Actinomyces sp. B33]MDC4233176.1 nucleoside-diphosphate kinase [Actinomyces sp. B33]